MLGKKKKEKKKNQALSGNSKKKKKPKNLFFKMPCFFNMATSILQWRFFHFFSSHEIAVIYCSLKSLIMTNLPVLHCQVTLTM